MPTLTSVHQGYNLFATEIGEHVVEVDIPLSKGGADRAPTAPQIFMASISSCIGTFAVEYCNRVGIDTTDLAVEVDFDLLEDPIRLGPMTVRILIPHADVGDRLEAVRRAGSQCTLHHTLEQFEGMTVEVLDRTALETA